MLPVEGLEFEPGQGRVGKKSIFFLKLKKSDFFKFKSLLRPAGMLYLFISYLT